MKFWPRDPDNRRIATVWAAVVFTIAVTLACLWAAGVVPIRASPSLI